MPRPLLEAAPDLVAAVRAPAGPSGAPARPRSRRRRPPCWRPSARTRPADRRAPSTATRHARRRRAPSTVAPARRATTVVRSAYTEPSIGDTICCTGMACRLRSTAFGPLRRDVRVRPPNSTIHRSELHDRGLARQPDRPAGTAGGQGGADHGRRQRARAGRRRAVRGRGRQGRDRRRRRRHRGGRGDPAARAARRRSCRSTSATTPASAARSSTRCRRSAGCTCSTTTPASPPATTTARPTRATRRGRPCSTSTSPASPAAAGTASRRCSTSGGGSIINVASFVAHMGAATPQIAYTASKGAVLSMTREIAVHLRPPGHPRQRAVSRPGAHAAAGQVPVRRRQAPAPAGARPDGPLRRADRDRQRAHCSSPPTTRRS